MELVGLVINTAVLLFVAGLVVAYGKWVGGEIMAINQKLAKWALPIETVGKCKEDIVLLQREFAVHCAAPHCGEEDSRGGKKP
jgi:hypothetical protein